MRLELQNIQDIPAHIFGSGSMLCDGAAAGDALMLQGVSFWFVVVVFVVLLCYLLWLNHWSARGVNHHMLLSLFTYFRHDYVAKLQEVSPSFERYITTGSFVGFVAFWLASLSYFGLSISQRAWLSLALLVGVISIFFFQIVVLYLGGRLINNRGFAKVLLQCKKINYATAGIVILPTILCYSLTNGKEHEVFMYLVVLQLVVVTSIYVYKTFVLFLCEKVSVLHTILYLCGVEIFPITLVWGIFCK